MTVSPKAFEELRARQRFLEAIAAGIGDVESGRVVEDKKVRAWLKSWGSGKERGVPR